MRKKLKPLVLFIRPISGLLKVCLAQYWLSITPPPSDNFPLDESSLRPKHDGRGTGTKLHIRELRCMLWKISRSKVIATKISCTHESSTSHEWYHGVPKL